MTDLVALMAMLDRAKVAYEVSHSDAEVIGGMILKVGSDGPFIPGRESPNRGYNGFFTEFAFDADGALLWIGAYE